MVKKLLKIIDNFSKKKILVIGDIMLDKYIYGETSRISPEAPVPIVYVSKQTMLLGGAGNVAKNIIDLGGKVELLGVIGNDVDGENLKKILRENNIPLENIFVDNNRPTTVKMRIISQHQQIVRVDFENSDFLDKKIRQKLKDCLEEKINNCDCIIISDYGKGIINKDILFRIIQQAKKAKIPVIADPKLKHFFQYKRVTCITPNQHEAGQVLHLDLGNEKNLIRGGKKILKRLDCDSVLITRGEKGMTIFEKSGKIKHIPTMAKEVFDVTGAGDTVISTFAISLVSGANLYEAAYLANCAAGIVVGKLGTATVSPIELKRAIEAK